MGTAVYLSGVRGRGGGGGVGCWVFLSRPCLVSWTPLKLAMLGALTKTKGPFHTGRHFKNKRGNLGDGGMGGGGMVVAVSTAGVTGEELSFGLFLTESSRLPVAAFI